MNKTMQRKYARLIVRKGANVQKGQGVYVHAAVERNDFVKLVVEEAYRAGAGWVRVEWSSQDLTRLHYRHASVKTLSEVPQWRIEKFKEQIEKVPAVIHITSEDPDGLAGLNREKMQKVNLATYKVMKPYIDELDNKYQWVIAGIPSPKWAKKVFPNERTSKAVEMLWEAILQSARVTKDNDAELAWDQHNANFKDKCDKLNSYKFTSLHYTADNGTDLTVGMIPDAMWLGGGETALNGVYFNPNMPTEEIFTTPMRGKADGVVYSTKPLSYFGQMIENFSITFKDGKAVSWTAEKGEDLLTKMLTMDEGSAMLGETALIPYDSPINNSGILFYSTLYDENASCHLAIGRGFSNVLPDYADLSTEEALKRGINDSVNHVDFMIGTKDMCITGTTPDGEEIQIFKDGNWAF